MAVFQILEQLGAESGTNAKIDIVKANADNEVLRKLLFLENDPNTNFHMKKLPPVVPGGGPTATFDDMFEVLGKLAERSISGNAAKAEVGELLGRMGPEMASILERILLRDLRIAMGIKNCNKALGKDFLKETPYMRCELTNKKTLERLRWVTPEGDAGVVSEVKMDGQYLNHIVRNGYYSAESRNGKPYDFLGVMDSEFAKLAKILETDFNIIDPVFNGEAVVYDGEGGVLPRTTGNGIIQKFGKDTGNILDAQNVMAVIWDVLPYEAYRNGEWKVERKARREMLESALNKLNKERQDQRDAITENKKLSEAEKKAALLDIDFDKVQMVKYKKVKSFKEAYAYNTEIMAGGEEGTIIKDERGPWKAHTSPWQLKMKLKFEIDLKVVGFEAGKASGKFKNSLGALIIESSDGLLRCKVGTGFKEKFCPKKDIGTKKEYSDDMVRQYIWDNQDKFLGMIVTVEANDIVQDRNSDILKLFLPVFVEWRYDKNDFDDIPRIEAMKEAAVIALLGEAA